MHITVQKNLERTDFLIKMYKWKHILAVMVWLRGMRNHKFNIRYITAQIKRSGNNQSVGSSVSVVSRWLWPGNMTFLVVTSMVVTWWTVTFMRRAFSHIMLFLIPFLWLSWLPSVVSCVVLITLSQIWHSNLMVLHDLKSYSIFHYER